MFFKLDKVRISIEILNSFIRNHIYVYVPWEIFFIVPQFYLSKSKEYAVHIMNQIVLRIIKKQI